MYWFGIVEIMTSAGTIYKIMRSVEVFNHHCLVVENSYLVRWTYFCDQIVLKQSKCQSCIVVLIIMHAEIRWMELPYSRTIAWRGWIYTITGITFLQQLPQLPLWTDSRAMLGSMISRQKWQLSHHARVTHTTVRRRAHMLTCNVASALECWHVHA